MTVRVMGKVPAWGLTFQLPQQTVVIRIAGQGVFTKCSSFKISHLTVTVEVLIFFFFQTVLFTSRSLTLLTVLITLTLYLLLTLLILILTLIMHTLHYDTCITILLTLI